MGFGDDWAGAFGLREGAAPGDIEHGRFEPMPLTVPASPRSVALLLAGAAERELGDALSAQVVREGGIVARVDAEAFARVLDATPSGCVFPSGISTISLTTFRRT